MEQLSIGYPETLPVAEATEHHLESSCSEDKLVRQFRQRLVNMLTLMTGNPDLAQDLAQETLIVTLRSIRNNRIREKDRIASFVFSTARYIYFGWLRKADNQVELREDLDSLLHTEIDHEALFVQEEEGTRIRGLIDSLSRQRDKEIIIRHYLVEDPKPNTCDALELTSEHFDRVLCRAKGRLRDRYIERYGWHSKDEDANMLEADREPAS